jgi:hypothetical protein
LPTILLAAGLRRPISKQPVRCNQKGSLNMKAAKDCRRTSVQFLSVGRQSFADDPFRGRPSPPDFQAAQLTNTR